MELNEFFYQHYWWFIISLLGALLVFLLFVQGGQEMGVYVYDFGGVRRGFFCIIPIILFYEFRRSILVMDGYSF